MATEKQTKPKSGKTDQLKALRIKRAEAEEARQKKAGKRQGK